MTQEQMREVLEKIDRKAYSALSFPTSTSSREYLEEIRKIIKEASDRPSLADDPDDDVEFCKWREDHNIDLGDKWVAWGAWQGAIQRFALDRSSEVELLLDALQEHHLFAQLRPDGDAYRESETYRKTTAALAPFLASDHPSNSGDE
jgi:hypothetical protein